MVCVRDVAEAIECFAPLSLQAAYDNSGLQVGRMEREVRGVLVCMDVSQAVLDEARALGCNMVVTHHPLLFNGLKSVCGASRESLLVERAITEGVSLYAAHTNLDFTRGGVSFWMGEQLGLGSMRPLNSDASGREMGVVGDLGCALAPEEFVAYVKARFGVFLARCSAECSVSGVKRVALCGGSGMDLYDAAAASGAEAYVTGDAKYHDFQRGVGRMLLVDIGHRESEAGAVALLARLIREKIPNFAVHKSTRDGGPVRYC